MAKDISTFKSDLQRKLRGTSLSRVADVYATIGEAGGNILAEIDPLETVRIQEISGAVHDDVYDYAAPSDLKGNKIIDIRPQTGRTLSDNVSQRGIQDFDLKKAFYDDKFAIYYDDGTKWIRYSKDVDSKQVVIDNCSGITDNGAWSVGTDGTNLTKDTLVKLSGGASLNFDVDGSTTSAYIENSTLTDVDLSDHDEQSKIFVWVYVPNSQAITNFILRWGNDASNYWSVTVTEPNFGSFRDGWNLLSFNWNGATETGTVDPSAIDYVRLTVTYDGTPDTDFRLDQIFSSLGEIWEIIYYSSALFRDVSGSFLETPTSDTDLINLEHDAYNILIYETARLVTQEVGGEDAMNDYRYYTGMLYGDAQMAGLYKLYKQSNLSQTEKMQSTYYRI